MKVHRSNRAEALAERLAEVVAAPLDGPFAGQVVLVHSSGMGRWLSMEIAQKLGVCAGLEFPFPAAFLRKAVALLAGAGAREAQEAAAWESRRLIWPVLTALTENLDRPEMAPLKRYLENETSGRRAIEIASRLADAFDQYLSYRPELVLEWGTGADAGAKGQEFQPFLWRELLRARGSRHFAALAAQAEQRVADGSARLPEDFPRRVAVFGISALPPIHLRALSWLARLVEVHLFVLTPTPHYFSDIKTPREHARLLRRAGSDATPERLHLTAGHPLLASMGRLARDFQDIFEEVCGGMYEEDESDLFREPAGNSLLTVLQADIFQVRRRGPCREYDPAHQPPLEVSPRDRSIRIHSCHGPLRQVEVLRDELLELFRDPAFKSPIEPRDVVVMCPDIETFAPFIEAVFSEARAPGWDGGLPRIPFRIADAGMRRENPVAEAFFAAIEVLRGRARASEILDLIGFEPVRRRLGLAPEREARMREWVVESGIRWGFDAQHRAQRGQPEVDLNTWRFGLERLLLGLALPVEGRPWAGRAPCWLGQEDAEGLGRLAEFIASLAQRAAASQTAKTIPEWSDFLMDLMASVLEAPGRRSAESDGQHLELARLVMEVASDAQSAGFSGKLDLEAVSALLTERCSTRRRSGGFLAGGVTFCAMVPMRSIPFRVVVLLGMDDGAFPRQSFTAELDLAQQHPRPGDRNLRDEDRHLFLESLLAARERLLIFTTGRSARDNSKLPAAVPVSELLDTLRSSFLPPPHDPNLDAFIVVEHPLQPFSPRNYSTNKGASGPLSFDGRGLEAARRIAARAGESPPWFLIAPLAATLGADPPNINLDELARFFASPARHLARRRLGLYLDEMPELPEDREALDPKGLARWSLGNDALRSRLAGENPEGIRAALTASGRLPHGTSGGLYAARLLQQVEDIAACVNPLLQGKSGEIEVDLALPRARLSGGLRGFYAGGLVEVHFGQIHARHLASLWVRHLALQASGPDTARASHIAGTKKSGKSIRPQLQRFEPLGQKQALSELAGLAELFLQGQSLPLLFFPESSRAYAKAVLKDGDDPAALREARAAAGKEWLHRGQQEEQQGEGTDACHALFFPESPPYAEDFGFPGCEWPEKLGFHALALEFWTPLLKALEDG